MLLAETTTEDAKEAFDDVEVAVIPVGSTEQHGPALPMCTDSKSAEAVAEGVGQRSDVVVLPNIPIGVSPHHRQFHGTLWVSEENFKSYLSEALENFTVHGIEKFAIVNGHGGNVGAIDRIARELYREESAFVVPWSWWEGVGDIPVEQMGDDVKVPGHAGGFETAMMLHLAPDLVRSDRFEDATTDLESRFDHLGFDGFDFADWTENGSHGSPGLASADVGKAVHEAAIESLNGLLDWMVDLPREECYPRPHK